jgi:hypothetical protein
MNELLKMRFFELLAEPSQEVTNEEMQKAYGHFVEQVNVVSNSKDKTFVFRVLNITRIELAALEPFYRYEQGEKRPEIEAPAQSPFFS